MPKWEVRQQDGTKSEIEADILQLLDGGYTAKFVNRPRNDMDTMKIIAIVGIGPGVAISEISE